MRHRGLLLGAAWTLASVLVAGCSSNAKTAGSDAAAPDTGSPAMTFRQASDAALKSLTDAFYHDGNWNLCEPKPCNALVFDDFDWGSDSFTAALYLRFTIDRDSSIVPMMQRLDANGVTYGSCTGQGCPSWSDVPLWDSIAASHEHLVTHATTALARAKAAFAYVDTATEFARGACPEIDFQVPVAGGNPLTGTNLGVKTLETDSNYVKAALLLHQLTGDATYLDKAVNKYASVRKYFLDPAFPLYTVYVIDDGKTCTQVPRRFYGSVNGNMIWSGIGLASATGQKSYLDEAIATATAVADHLADAAGVYADLQTDDDVVEPLIEGMYRLATDSRQSFARKWLRVNATAMSGARRSDGIYGRFLDGPPPPGQVTMWEANGGIALAFVAGGLFPSAGATTNANAWRGAIAVEDDDSKLPSSIQFSGRAIAVFGTLGDTSNQLGQARVFVDGVETFDQTGIHQNEVNAFGKVPNAVLFAWRWPDSGSHTLRFEGQTPDPKDGGPFLHVSSYSYVP